MVMAKDTQKLVVTKCPTYGELFECFMRGLHKRMGEIVSPDQANSLELMVEIYWALEQEWSSPYTDSFQLTVEGSFYLIAFCCALWGEEVPLVDLFGVRKHREEGASHPLKQVVIALLGWFKGKTRENYHLMCIVAMV